MKITEKERSKAKMIGGEYFAYQSVAQTGLSEAR